MKLLDAAERLPVHFHPDRAFAADLSTPAVLAASALAWHEHIRYGLWRIDDPVPRPGL